jgi:hypothetical protein
MRVNGCDGGSGARMEGSGETVGDKVFFLNADGCNQWAFLVIRL